MKKLTNTNLYRNVSTLLVFLIFITSSFDIVGVIDLGGFTFRISQLFTILLVGVSIAGGSWIRLRKFLGGGWALIWVILQGLFIVNSVNIYNAVGYYLWLLFDMLTVIAIVQNVGRSYSQKKLVNLYLSSFLVIAILGLVQQFLYAFGINFFVTQAWNARLARINGFCFEPSYYATYLMPGFITYAYLFEKKDTEYLTRRKIVIGLFFISLAIILSSSRMGWLTMAVWIVLRLCIYFVRFFRQGFTKKTLINTFLGLMVITLMLVGVITVVAKSDIDLMFLFNGVGLFGKSAHSTTGRMKALVNCIEVFKQSPWIGYSLGGVDPALAKYQNVVFIKNGAGSVIGEILAANGVVGLIPFIGYMFSLVFGRKHYRHKKKSTIYKAFVWAFIFQMIILCMNQNILRAYVWSLIGVLSAVEYNEYFSDDPKTVNEGK